MAQQQGWRRVELETDCRQVVKIVYGKEDDVGTATVVHDIRELKSKFDECCFAFTNRVNNFVSHNLAKLAVNLEQVTEWKENFPAWLLEHAQVDCMAVA